LVFYKIELYILGGEVNMIKVIAKNFTHENKKSELIELLKELKHYAIKEKKMY